MIFHAANNDINSPYITLYKMLHNSIYILNTKTGKLNKYEFFGKDSKYNITYAGSNSNNDFFIYLGSGDGAESEYIMYYVNLKDLKKK